MTKKPYIICIDNDTMILDSLKKKIECEFSDRCYIVVFQSAYDALDEYEKLINQEDDIPIVICDLLTHIRGDEILCKIHNLCSDTKNILLSGEANLIDIMNTINKTRIFKYISKPWNDSDLYNIIAEGLDIYSKTKENNSLRASITELKNKLDALYSKENEKIVAWEKETILLFDTDDVFFFSSEGRQIIANTRKGKYRVKKTMSQLESSLVDKRFFRCHKSYLINLKYVNKISPWIGYDSYFSTIDGCNHQIPVSRNYIKEMKRLLGI